MTSRESRFVFAAKLDALQQSGCKRVYVEGHTLALFDYGGTIYAIDSRCPHMGFPLDQGSVKDGILTCHWHHARFDLASGGAFDLFTDDVRAFPTEVRGDEVWVDIAPQVNPAARLKQRLQDGLERNLSLVIAKSVIGLMGLGGTNASGADAGVEDATNDLTSADLTSAIEPFQIGLAFGTRYRQDGWSTGLTILTCMMNMLPYLAPEDRARALYHGLSAVAQDTDGMAPRFMVQPLPAAAESTDLPTLKRWFRRFIEVRDTEGAERCVISAVRMGASPAALADLLFAAVTDHRYISTGHPLDFTNKALEALDIAGWSPDQTAQVLTSLANGYARASRMEESNAWRNPIDLIAILDRAFEDLAAMNVASATPADEAAPAAAPEAAPEALRDRLVAILLGDDPQASVDALLQALREGLQDVALAGIVAYAAALRIARFHTSNEFGDWDTALHTFTFANAVHQGLRRTHSRELLRGVFDAAMSIYLDRFLNVPAARIPSPRDQTRNGTGKMAEANGAPTSASTNTLTALVPLLDRQQQVEAAAALIAQQLYEGADARQVMSMLGKLLLREDRNFHTIQVIEAAIRQHELLARTPAAGTPAAEHVLIAAGRYLAAHSPTMRAQGQTFNIAQRLARGERLFEETSEDA